MNKRQKARIELETKIWDMVQDGKTDMEIVEALDVNLERVQSVRQQNGMKRYNVPRYYPRVDDFKHEEKEIVGKRVVIKGKTYIDITGDIIDCGIEYRRN